LAPLIFIFQLIIKFDKGVLLNITPFRRSESIQNFKQFFCHM
jgi:hypothetical protein